MFNVQQNPKQSIASLQLERQCFPREVRRSSGIHLGLYFKKCSWVSHPLEPGPSSGS